MQTSVSSVPQEPQQSGLYKTYMEQLRWTVITVQNVQVFVKKFPFGQGIMKIHRPESLPEHKTLLPILKQYSIKTLVIEPVMNQNETLLHRWLKSFPQDIRIHTKPFLPTKTIQVRLDSSEESIFLRFSEAKRRGVRRAIKLGVTVHESDSMDDLVSIKNKSAGFLGFITTSGMKPLWPVFSPDHASILLAYDTGNLIIGGVLLLHWDSVTYYWIAGATKHGKKLFAPTLLAWEAIKLAKRKGSAAFDFVGVWDERIPKENSEWKGFTKFKEGFGGVDMYYPLVHTP